MAAVSDVDGGGGDTTEDAFLGGRVVLRQPRRGHRSGMEAVMIAAAAPVLASETVLDIGAGVGAAGLCVLARCQQARAVLVDADEAAAELARHNAAANGMADRASIRVLDVAAIGAANRAGLAGLADHAVANPPFHDPSASRTSPAKARAHAAGPDDLEGWARFAAAALKPGGSVTVVHRADALDALLSVLSPRFGALRVLPVQPRPGLCAVRVMVQGRKGARGPLALLPALTLHGADGHGFAPEAEAILRDAAPLDLAGRGSREHV